MLSLGIGVGLTKGQPSGIVPGWSLLGMSESSPANGATFTKTAPSSDWTNNYVTSAVALHGDGSISWTSHTGDMIVGLAPSLSGLPGAAYNIAQYSVYTQASGGMVLDTIESGIVINSFVPGWAFGDLLEIKVTGATVTYINNGVVLATSAVPASFPLYAGGWGLTNAAKIENLTLAGAWR
jgi:hypothetical protein